MALPPPRPLPVSVVTGFLGAGKTTLLNHLLSNERRLRVGALVNEFGAIDIDSSLLVSNNAIESGVTQLANGCICCTINDSLCDALEQLLEYREQLDYLLLETTGLADPEPVLETLRLPQFATTVRVDAVVTVIDAASFAAQHGGSGAGAAASDGWWASSEAARQQLFHADLVVLNKKDLVTPAQLHEVSTAAARATRKGARLLHCQRGQLAPELVLDLHLASPQLASSLDAVEAAATGAAEAAADTPSAAPSATATAKPSAAPSAAPSVAADATAEATPAADAVSARGASDTAHPTAQQTWARAPPRPHPRHHSAHLRQDNFSSVAYESTARLRLAAFEQLRLSADWADVVRAKGFVSFVECPGYQLTLQACGARLEAHASAVAPSAASPSRLVLLGQGLQPRKLLRLLRACEARECEEASAVGECEEASAVGECEDGGADGAEVANCDGCGDCVGSDGGSGGEGGGSGGGGEDESGVEACEACEEEAPAAAATPSPTAVFARKVAADPRFEVAWQRGGGEGSGKGGGEAGGEGGGEGRGEGLVAFRLLAWLGVEADTLNEELLARLNRSGRAWAVPHRAAGGELLLLQPTPTLADGAESWAQVQAAAEVVMLSHFGGYFCGACDCLDVLAGQVLT